MNLLLKPLRTEVFFYTSDKPAGRVAKTTQKLITDSWLLVGKFSSPSEFYLYPSFQIGVNTHGHFNRNNSNAFLLGKIYEEDSKTIVQLTLKPSNLFIFLFFLFPSLAILFIILKWCGIFTDVNDMMDILYMPLFILLYCYLSKLWLRYKVVSSLGLKPNE